MGRVRSSVPRTAVVLGLTVAMFLNRESRLAKILTPTLIFPMIIAPVIGIFSFPLPSMLYALDRPDAPLKARLVGTIVYFGIIAPLSWRFGVLGAASAFVLGYASMALMLALQVRNEYRRVRARPA